MPARWKNSITVRYVAVSLIAALLPLMAVSILYERYASNLLEALSGERLERRLTVISSRMSAFLEGRFYQLETLAEYPALASLARSPQPGPIDPRLRTLLSFEADQPDLYGILLYTGGGRLARAIPGQAAAGPPYWGHGALRLAHSAEVATPRGDLIGPLRPRDGRPASMVLVRRLRAARGADSAGKIALHVRLASLTELMGLEDVAGLYRPLLLTPDGAAYSAVAVPETRAVNLLLGPEFAPGWRPALEVAWDRVWQPLWRVRYALFGGIALVVVLLVTLFFRLSRRIAQRVGGVVDGAEVLASGDLGARIASRGNDEIAILAKAFNKMAERLEQVVRSTVEVEKIAVLGQFATGVAHEVRNPLAAIKTSAQALLSHEDDPRRKAILDGICEEIDRLDESVGDLLNYARPHTPKIGEIRVAEVFDRVVAMLVVQAREAGVEVSASTPPGLTVRVDESHLQQILMNLTLNALQAMPGGGRLSLSASHGGGLARLGVEDTGPGMGDDVLRRLTDPFFTTRPGGTGLGLAISRQLAELNHGRLTFVSAPGQGCIATLLLPLGRHQHG